MTLSVVIPTWNRRDLLDKLLRNLQDQTLTPDKVLVVDNGSSDGSADLGRSLGATVIGFVSNQGFARAVNAGVEAAGSELVAILNNDVFLARDYLAELTAALDSTSAAFACGKLYSETRPQEIDATFDAVSRGGTAWRCGAGRDDGPVWSEPRDITFAPFTALAVRRAVYMDVGGLDERFESYLEDVDFGLRCASKGYTGRYVPSAKGWHLGSATLGVRNSRTVRYISRNQVFLVARHYPTATLIRYGWQIATAQLLWGLVALRYGAGFAWLAGKAEGLLMWTSIRRNGAPEVASILGSSEQLIRALQRQTGYDWYWRLYFALS